MLGLMQQQPLLISSLLKHAARHHAEAEVISATNQGETYYTQLGEHGTRRAAAGARAAIAWRQTARPRRHARLERLPPSGSVLRAPGMQAICHTINPRLHPDDIAYIINHAGDSVLFVDTSFAPLIGNIAPKHH